MTKSDSCRLPPGTAPEVNDPVQSPAIKMKLNGKNKFLPNAEAQEVGPREQVVSTHKDADIGYCNVLKKIFIFMQVSDDHVSRN